jgi:histidinol phosphatase-like PHP family hydrolase
MLKLAVQKEKELEINTREKHPINYKNHAQKNLK